MRVHDIDHLVLNCVDIDKMLEWYTGKLGLAGDRVEQWRAGEVFFPSVRISEGSLIDLFPADPNAPAPTTANMNHFCLVVDRADVDRVANDPDFTVVDGPDMRYGAQGDGWAVYVTDPEGNMVELRSYDR